MPVEPEMHERLYVSTGREGLLTTSGRTKGPIEPRSLDGLLDDLGERIFSVEPGGLDPRALEPDGPGANGLGANGLEETAWDDRAAARFGLECATHALGGEGDVELTHGRTLEGVLDEVRRELDEAGSGDQSLGRLARGAAVRRLKRDGSAVGDLAMAAAKDDERTGIELADDPAWTSLAAIEEAVLASVEALRYLARPRHVASEEDRDERTERDEPGLVPQIEETPWGPIAPGGEHIPGHVAAAVCARLAAERARQAVADRSGEAAGLAERAWQAELLGRFLAGPVDPS